MQSHFGTTYYSTNHRSVEQMSNSCVNPFIYAIYTVSDHIFWSVCLMLCPNLNLTGSPTVFALRRMLLRNLLKVSIVVKVTIIDNRKRSHFSDFIKFYTTCSKSSKNRLYAIIISEVILIIIINDVKFCTNNLKGQVSKS